MLIQLILLMTPAYMSGIKFVTTNKYPLQILVFYKTISISTNYSN